MRGSPRIEAGDGIRHLLLNTHPTHADSTKKGETGQPTETLEHRTAAGARKETRKSRQICQCCSQIDVDASPGIHLALFRFREVLYDQSAQAYLDRLDRNPQDEN